MTVRVECPSCAGVLNAPKSLIGQQAECPYCKCRFIVPDSDPGRKQQVAVPPPPPPAAGNSGAAHSSQESDSENLPPVMKMPPVRSSEPSPAAHDGDNPHPPPAAQPSPLAAKNTARFKSIPAEAPAASAADPPGSPLAARAKQPGHAAQRAPDPRHGQGDRSAIVREESARQQKRKPHRARFIAADPSQSEVQLGADGSLPELVLKEVKKEEKKPAEEKTSNPVMLIAVFVFSLAFSVGMLFIDTTVTQTDGDSKKEARWTIERYYLTPRTAGREYHQLLEQGLLAHSRGDYREERQYYLKVLDMLHSEGNPQYTGLTGAINDTKPPNDRHLKDQLTILLRE